MTHNQQICFSAETQKNKPLLLFRMIRVINQQCIFIIEYCLRFLKRYSMLSLINNVFVGVPFEIQLIHNYNIIIVSLFVKYHFIIPERKLIMLQLETAQGTAFPITWIGISDLDGSLRFETTETDMPLLFSLFSDPEHTRSLTRVFDEDRRTFEGFTVFKGIEKMGTGNIVVRLLHP